MTFVAPARMSSWSLRLKPRLSSPLAMFLDLCTGASALCMVLHCTRPPNHQNTATAERLHPLELHSLFQAGSLNVQALDGEAAGLYHSCLCVHTALESTCAPAPLLGVRSRCAADHRFRAPAAFSPHRQQLSLVESCATLVTTLRSLSELTPCLAPVPQRTRL
jgi:hypothetical protein